MMSSLKTSLLWLALVAGLTTFNSSEAIAQQREIKQVKGNLYLFRNNAHLSVFLVTSDGVIATDPINEGAAKWLEEEIRKRFQKEIKYVIYSHSDNDHIAGGQVFADTATVVAHENAAPIINDGTYTAPPNVTFSESSIVQLGDGQVKLHFFGVSHTDNLIVMEFPQQKAIFVVDSLNINRMPYRNLPSFYMPELIDFIKQVEKLDYEIAIPGHGGLGTPKDVARYRNYLEDLYIKVEEAHKAGKSLEQAQASIQLEQYKDFDNYEAWLPLNIEGVYRNLNR
ncbi:MBL fold metallo-hydrolase [Alteromonadaceae bacterium M269]|nr:MBL fold metallo-hydrolase [Alteromonadaceae bacterium M269]